MTKELKQVIVVRTDISMSPGKLAAQVAHASVTAILDETDVEVQTGKMVFPPQCDTFFWFKGSQVKIVLAGDNTDHLLDLYHKAQNVGLPRSIIKDEGRTEFANPTYTAMAIGPGDPDLIDQITGDLKLL